MRQINRILIHRLRGLCDVALDDLGQVNLLVGPNNSGKTSALEAVSVYCQPLDAVEWVQTAWRREADRANLSQVDALKWLFPQDGKARPGTYQGEVRLAGEGAYSVREVTARFEEAEETLPSLRDLEAAYSERAERSIHLMREQLASGDRQHRSAELTKARAEMAELQDRIRHREITGRTATTHRGARLSLSVQATTEGPQQQTRTVQIWEDESLERSPADGPVGWSLPVSSITPFAHRVEQSQIRHLTDASLSGFKDEVVAAVQLLDPQVRDLEILSPSGVRPGLYVRHAQVGLAPLSAFGDGLRRTLVYALALPALAHGVLLIDELEAAIHISALPGVFAWLVQACQRHDVQVFATTHSLEAVDAILQAERLDLSAIAGFRIDAGQPQPVTRYGGDMLRRLRYERGLDVR